MPVISSVLALLVVPVVLALPHGDPCSAAVAAARAQAEEFDLPGSLELARRAEGCGEAAGFVEYLEGLLGARGAVKAGGTMESLQDVRSAANALSRRAEEGDRRWQVASLVLRAAAAASQSERDEMALYLAEALRIEDLLLAARQQPAPLVTAHEAAGDLWLQVHRFEEARRAYVRAAQRIGRTSRVRLGLARTAARLTDRQVACQEYDWLLEWWDGRPGTPAEIAEAQSYVRTAPCTPQ